MSNTAMMQQGDQELMPLGRYLKEHWQGFFLAVAGGVTVALLGSAWLRHQAWLHTALGLQDARVLGGIALAVFALLLVSFPSSVRFWRRYRRTQVLGRPPLQFVDVLAVTAVSTLSTWLVLDYSRFGQAWQADISEAMRFFLLGLGLLGSLWLIGPLLWSRREEKGVASGPMPRAQPAGDVYDDPYDDPIIDDEQDLLGRVQFVDGLYEQIHELPTPQSFVFGLSGGWGEGKTSVLNLLQRRLRQDSALVPIPFNPWYLASEAAIIHQFYGTIEQSLRERYLVTGLHSILSRYGSLLTAGLGALGGGFKLTLRDRPERLRKELEEWIRNTGCRLVLLIDDIDRLAPAEALAVLKLVGLSGRIQQAVFVLSFDSTVVATMFRERADVDPAFLEKIIQKPLPLPPAEQRDIDRFLLLSDADGPAAHKSGIDRLLDDLRIEPARRQAFDQKIVYLYFTHLRKLFRTLRQVKRYLNSLRTTLPPVRNEVDLYDFVLLEILQVFFPHIYQDIWTAHWFYISPWSAEATLASQTFFTYGDAQEQSRRIREHIKQILPQKQADIAQALVKELFPQVKNAFTSNPRMHDGGNEATYRREKRLAHPACFPKYFLLRIPAQEIADQEVEERIRTWNEAPAHDAENLVIRALRDCKQQDKLRELLIKLRIFLERVEPRCVPAIVRAIYKSVPLFSHSDSDFFLESEFAQAEGLIVRLIEEKAEETQIQSLLEEIVNRVPSLPFAVLVVSSCGQGGHHFRLDEHLDRQALRRCAVDRLHTYYIAGNRDIFAELSDRDWGGVLYQWADWIMASGEHHAEVQNYIMGLIEQRPAYLGRLLRHFVHQGRFRFSDFCHVYDPAVIHERLTQYGEHTLTTAEEQQAARLFRQAYREAREQDESQGRE